MAKQSSGSESRSKLAQYPGTILCKGTRSKPLAGSYACRQVLGVVGRNGISIKCRRCKTIVEYTWTELKELRESVLSKPKSK